MELADFRNLHREKRLFVLASGPSLAGLDLAPLERRLVMGLNRSAWIYPDTHYHCVMDQRLFGDLDQELRRTRYLFTLEGRPYGFQLPLLGSEGFSFDLQEGIYSGYTVSYFALQVAVYLGFREIVYLGLDLCHSGPKTHFFGSDYRSATHEETEFPRMRRLLASAAALLRDRGVRLFNCSPVSTLDAFERISYEDALAR